MRYVLIDYMHLTYKTHGAEPLNSTINIGGQVAVVETTIPNYTIKDIYRYSRDKESGSRFMLGVFLEGGNSWRKEYFLQKALESGKVKDAKGYKGTRENQNSGFYQQVNLAVKILVDGKVSCFRQPTFEADDLICSMVALIKSIDNKTPIDIITNDSDMLPLVDHQVSVYMRGNRTEAVAGCPERKGYFQVTPNTWYEYLRLTSKYKAFDIPFNSMLLHKLIRGDDADNVPASTTGLGGVNYTKLMARMRQDGVDFENTFRYWYNFDEVIAPVLSNYFDAETVADMKFVYEGISPRYIEQVPPKQLDPDLLQEQLNWLHINLWKR